MNLSLEPLEKAILQLEESISYFESDLAAQDERLALHLRAACIQAFEFTYELCWKMLKRYLTMTSSNPENINLLSFNDLIRMGSDKGLLKSDLPTWQEYRKERGTTSHTYSEEKAEEVYEDIPGFLEDAKFLLDQLKERTS